MHSVWSDTADLPRFPTLQGEVKTDVLIIGGGMCGVLCAYQLAQMGVDYVLVEGNTICSGVTKNTTAKLTVQHGLIYDKLIKSAGKEQAAMYLQANQDGLEEYKRLCKNTDCAFEEKSAYTYTMQDRGKIEAEVKAYETLGYRAEFAMPDALPLKTQGAVRLDRQAQFHPLKFIAGIVKGLNIYENSFVRSLDTLTARTDEATVTAKKIIVATHFPFLNTHGSYFLKLYQERSYVIALSGAPDVGGMYVDEAQKGKSFRNYAGLLFVGGGDHRTGKQGGNWAELRAFAKTHYPKAVEQYAWATQDCMPLDDVPYIGHYSAATPDLYVASGFKKWGMTTAMAAALLLADKVTGKDREWGAVFSPQRSILKPQLFVNGIEAAANLLTISKKRCPHLGCALKWNAAERTWDCPCHGSRFEKDGTLIDNPATGGAKVE